MSDKICDKIKYLISKNSGITNSINYNFGKIRIDSYNSLPIKKMLTFHSLIILNKSLLIEMKMNTTIIYFYKKVCIHINSNKQYLYIINAIL